MRFYGSAMPFPHVQGAFREHLVALESQCVKADGLTAGEAAMAEPLSVCLHATRRAGELLGKRVLITGSGPIGSLCVLAARAAGAVEIVVTDLSDAALSYAGKAGADRVINTRTDPDALSAYATGKGSFDVLYECRALQAAGRRHPWRCGAFGHHSAWPRAGDIDPAALHGHDQPRRSTCAVLRFYEGFAVAVRLMAGGADQGSSRWYRTR